MNRLKYSLLIILFSVGFSQTGKIYGLVKDAESGNTLAGANISISGTELGAASDVNGFFEVENIPVGAQTIIVNYIGYAEFSQSVDLDEGAEYELNVSLSPEAIAGMVVTAFGIQREERSLGFSSQSISGDDLMGAPDANVISSLNGKAAGVDVINSTGNVGGSTKIVLRGNSSLSNDNQPLIIVDGVYIDNSNFDQAQASGWSTSEIDYGNAAMDLNGEDIKSVTILKGPNAAALYGSRAANGAIIIETKDGKEKGQYGFGIDVKTTNMTQTILEFPEYQNNYGQGKIDSEGIPRFEYGDGKGGGVFDAVGESWGPKMDDGYKNTQWWSNGELMPWNSNPGNTRSFFENGSEVTNTVALYGSFENSNFRLSSSKLKVDGITPNAGMEKLNVQFSGGMKFNDKLSANARVSQITMEALNRAEAGYNWNNVMFTIGQWTGRQIDMDKLSDYKDSDGVMRNWSGIHENPYWIQYENTNGQLRNRVIGSMDLNYNLNDQIEIQAFFGNDWYTDRRNAVYAKGSHRTPNGEYYERFREVRNESSRLIAKGDFKLTDDLSVVTNIGAERVENGIVTSSAHAKALSLPNLYTIENAAIRPTLTAYQGDKRVNSVFGSASFGYRDYLYVDITGRNDWSSTLPKENNSYFYPSMSTGLVFSDLLGSIDWLSYGKLRFGWTKVGSDTDPYQLQGTYVSQDAIGNLPTYSIDSKLYNRDLLPEETSSVEFGLEMSFLNNRLGFDLTHYVSNTRNQILPVQVSRTSGYSSQVVNIGEIENKGIELIANYKVLNNGPVRWDVTFNYTTNKNMVVSLAPGLETYKFGGRGASVEARPGEAFGTLYGTQYLRNDAGKIIVNSKGVPMRNTTIKGFGTYSPDWAGGMQNSFSYKDWRFSFTIDTKQGGVIHSDHYRWGRYSGTLIETLDGRDNTFVYDGDRHSDGAVKEDGSPNDIPIDMKTVYDFNRHYYRITESTIFPADFIKLREVQLNYAVPKIFSDRLGLNRINVAFIGRNLLILDKKVPHIDPETALNNSNMQGIESNQIPPVRRFGISISTSL